MQTGSRPPAVAGFFYPSDRYRLLEEINRCFTDKSVGPGVRRFSEPSETNSDLEESVVDCFVVPHAGYAYSGPVAAHSYNAIKSHSQGNITAIILGPNHYGVGSGIAISPNSAWETPLGSVKVDDEASAAILHNSELIDMDEMAHSKEHSIEVQIPFMQAITSSVQALKIVPICLMLQDKESAEDVANSICLFLNSRKHKSSAFLIIGSSDLTHYEPKAKATEKDLKLIRCMEALDISSFYTALERNNVSACGYGAIAVAMLVSKRLGKKRGKLLKYATSGDVTGENSSVVGYCSVHFV